MIKIIQNTFRILTHAEKRRMLLLALADVVISVLDIAALAALLLLIDLYTRPGAASPEWLTRGNILPALGALALLFITKNLGAWFIYRRKYAFAYRVATRLSEQNMLQYLEGSYHDYVNQDSAAHIRRISQQPVEFAHYVLSGTQQLISECVLVVLTVAAILLYDASLFLLLCLALIPPLVVLSFYIKRRVRSVRGNIKSGSELTLQRLKEALTGYIESSIYGAKDFFADRYHAKQKMLNSYLAELQSVQTLPARMMEIFAIAGLLLLIGYNEFAKGDSTISVVAIGAFVAAAYKIIPGLVKMLNTSGQMKTYAFTAEDMLAGHTSHERPMQGTAALPVQSLSLHNVSFNYSEKEILENVSMSLARYELAGLSGTSGKGKTTLINLLLGFLEPDSGEISVNGSPATARQRRELWRATSYVKQQPLLIHDSILKNIVLTDGHCDAARLKEAVALSGLHTLVSQLPQGLETIITENGKNISGGQRQRIALARALYKDAGLLILDEPFNELDEGSEASLLQVLQCLAQKGKMILLITHNKKSLSFCTKIISLDAAC